MLSLSRTDDALGATVLHLFIFKLPNLPGVSGVGIVGTTNFAALKHSGSRTLVD